MEEKKPFMPPPPKELRSNGYSSPPAQKAETQIEKAPEKVQVVEAQTEKIEKPQNKPQKTSQKSGLLFPALFLLSTIVAVGLILVFVLFRDSLF